MKSTLDAVAAEQPYLTQEGRKHLLLTCWNMDLDTNTQDTGPRQFESYLCHYEEACTHLSLSHPSLKDCKHEHLCLAAQRLCRDKRALCESSILNDLPTAFTSLDAVRDCINFIGTAILLVDLTSWDADETLRDFMTRTMASNSTQMDNYRIPRSFNARSFEEKAGVKIVWTRDLSNHLEFSSNESGLAIFHHVEVLRLYEQSALGKIFPDGFLEETLRTLSVMLPVADKVCMRWFKSKQQKLGLDVAAGGCRHLQVTQRNISDFDFWRDRLIIAKDVYDSAQPSGISRFWHDDRNKTQWWTFWIAVLVLLLTLVGVVEGALQVYKAYRPAGA